MNGLFFFCTSLEKLPDISNWNLNSVSDISNMFCGCSSLNSLPDISKWNVINVNNMSNMFKNCKSLNFIPDISKWNIKKIKFKNTEEIISLFEGCDNLLIYPDISKWNIEIIEGRINFRNSNSESYTSSNFIIPILSESYGNLQPLSSSQNSLNENGIISSENSQNSIAKEEENEQLKNGYFKEYYENFYN